MIYLKYLPIIFIIAHTHTHGFVYLSCIFYLKHIAYEQQQQLCRRYTFHIWTKYKFIFFSVHIHKYTEIHHLEIWILLLLYVESVSVYKQQQHTVKADCTSWYLVFWFSGNIIIIMIIWEVEEKKLSGRLWYHNGMLRGRSQCTFLQYVLIETHVMLYDNHYQMLLYMKSPLTLRKLIKHWWQFIFFLYFHQ